MKIYGLFAAGGGVTAHGWDLGTFLNTLSTTGKSWANTLIIIMGIVLIGMAVYRIVMKLISKNGGGQEASWFKIVAMLAVGAVLLGFGANGVDGIAGYGADVQKTIDGLATGTPPTILWRFF